MIGPQVLVRHATLIYQGSCVFDQLNLELKAGKLTCLLGPSGVGKTSLLRMIAGLIVPDEKEQFSATVDCDNHQAVAGQVAYLAQQDLLLPWATALTNTVLGHRLRGKLSSSVLLKAKTLLNQVGLTGSLHQYPQQLSGGMKQRVALVRTLLEDKPIMLMDEPFSSLDAITRYQLQSLAARLLKGKTVLLVTHDPLEALRLADEIYILAGKPAQLTPIAQLSTPTPRGPGSSEVIHYQAALFHALTNAKEGL